MKTLFFSIFLAILFMPALARAAEPETTGDMLESSEDVTDTQQMNEKVPGQPDLPDDSRETNVLCEGACNKR